ncbi:MAG: hypothetical protein GY868_12495 [Deltaproteobacteria bacterium]|nr:hypothetical protein [Deltaproteobacteria bacterium]
MNSVVIAIGAAVLYVIAYNTYGKFIAGKIFKLDVSGRGEGTLLTRRK